MDEFIVLAEANHSLQPAATLGLARSSKISGGMKAENQMLSPLQGSHGSQALGSFSVDSTAVRGALSDLLPGLRSGQSFKFRGIAAAACEVDGDQSLSSRDGADDRGDDGSSGKNTSEAVVRRVLEARHFSLPDRSSCFHKTFYSAQARRGQRDGSRLQTNQLRK